MQAKEPRLPLANELFGKRPLFANTISDYPKCHPIIPFLRNLSRGDTVESVLQKFQEEAKEFPDGYRQLAAIRYYLHVMLWRCEDQWQSIAKGVTNYKTLLYRIERWRKPEEQVCLVTFNYDKMLESALPTVDINIRELEGYVSNKNYKIIKVHGSTNWGREINPPVVDDLLQNGNQGEVISQLIDRAAVLDISRRYRLVHQCPMWKSDDQKSLLFPALAIPVETKGVFECPEQHLDVLRECIANVTAFLVIGWRATENHFLQLLVEHLPKSRPFPAMVVAKNKEEAQAAGQRMKDAGIQCELLLQESGFTDFILSQKVDAFLKS